MKFNKIIEYCYERILSPISKHSQEACSLTLKVLTYNKFFVCHAMITLHILSVSTEN